MVRIFWVGALLEGSGFIVAVLLAWFVSSAFGQGLTKYPLHIGFLVDLLFILFSAILAERAEEPTLHYERRGRATRSWALVSFIISVGTLAPLASHAGKTFRDVFVRSENDLQETTILSEFLCAQGGTGCASRYFAITLILAIACIGLALTSVFVLRNTRPGEPSEEFAPHAYFSFSASVFLFGIYTLLSHKWDVSGPELAAITRGQLLWIFGSLVLVLVTFAVIGGGIASRTRGATETIRQYKKRDAEKDVAEDQVRAQVKAATTSLGMWLAAAALLLLLFWILQRNISTWGGVPEIRVPTSFYALTLLVVALGVAVAVTAVVAGGRSKGPSGTGPRPIRPIRPEGPQKPQLPTGPEEHWLRQRGRWVQDKFSQVWQALKRRIREAPQLVRHAAVAISVVLLISSAAFAVYEVLRRLPQEGAGGKEALRPSGSRVGKIGIPALTLTRAPIKCVPDFPLTWAHGEVEKVHTTSWSHSCSFEGHVSIPCWAASIVVAGTASVTGPAELESQRARDRGQGLAKVLEQRFVVRQCENPANVRTYVLNLGLYAKGPYSKDALLQREVYVLVGASEDNSEVAAAVEAFAVKDAWFAQYSRCDLYSVGPAGELSFMRELKCR